MQKVRKKEKTASKSKYSEEKRWKKSNQIFYRQFPIAIETISADFLWRSFPEMLIALGDKSAGIW